MTERSMTERSTAERGSISVRVAAVAGPIVVAAAASGLRALLTGTSAALLLVLVVVAVGIAGDRFAGVLAAISAAAAFDFFLTVPYYAFAIFDRDDIETAVLLLAIGVAVTEIAHRGRLHRERSSRREGYLDGVAHAARMAADGSSRTELIANVERIITDVLDLDECGFDPPAIGREGPSGRPVLGRDGNITWGGRTVDVDRDGLPTMDVIELPAGRAGAGGRFLLTASSRVRRPDREHLMVAITLAEQIPDTVAL